MTEEAASVMERLDLISSSRLEKRLSRWLSVSGAGVRGGHRLGWSVQGLGARVPEALGPGKRLDPKLSLRLGGWRRGGSQLNNYDETRSDHGPVGNTWLCYILVTIDYATYL